MVRNSSYEIVILIFVISQQCSVVKLFALAALADTSLFRRWRWYCLFVASGLVSFYIDSLPVSMMTQYQIWCFPFFSVLPPTALSDEPKHLFIYLSCSTPVLKWLDITADVTILIIQLSLGWSGYVCTSIYWSGRNWTLQEVVCYFSLF